MFMEIFCLDQFEGFIVDQLNEVYGMDINEVFVLYYWFEQVEVFCFYFWGVDLVYLANLKVYYWFEGEFVVVCLFDQFLLFKVFLNLVIFVFYVEQFYFGIVVVFLQLFNNFGQVVY